MQDKAQTKNAAQDHRRTTNGLNAPASNRAYTHDRRLNWDYDENVFPLRPKNFGPASGYLRQ